MSDDQLHEDGYLSGEERDDILRAIDDVRAAGAANVVVSRSRAPSVAAIDEDLWEVRGPDVEPVDSHGGGDSMTGAFATALATGDSHDTAVRLAMAAATAGVLRPRIGLRPTRRHRAPGRTGRDHQPHMRRTIRTGLPGHVGCAARNDRP